MPRAVGIIMDGNRRWAKARGLPSLAGHRAGFESLKEIARAAHAAGVEELTVYAFSTENWNRSKEEVEYLMDLLRHALTKGLEKVEERARIRFIGERRRFSAELEEKMSAIEERTKGNTEGTLVVALSYGGRAEILDAIQKHEGSAVTEESLRKHSWSAGLLDPELIIRTGGEKRLSNFLTWQSVYSELFFTDTFWPDFGEEEFRSILAEYDMRERRMGK